MAMTCEKLARYTYTHSYTCFFVSPAPSSAAPPDLRVEVETSQGTTKGCPRSDVYDAMTVVTCTHAPVGKAVHVTFAQLDSSDHPVLCEVRIFGRPFSSGNVFTHSASLSSFILSLSVSHTQTTSLFLSRLNTRVSSSE